MDNETAEALDQLRKTVNRVQTTLDDVVTESERLSERITRFERELRREQQKGGE